MFLNIGYKDIEVTEGKPNISIINMDEPGTIYILNKIKSSILDSSIRLAAYNENTELLVKNREIYSTGDNVSPVVIIHNKLEDLEWLLENQKRTKVYCILVTKENINSPKFHLNIQVNGRNKYLFEERKENYDETSNDCDTHHILDESDKRGFGYVETSSDLIRSLNNII